MKKTNTKMNLLKLMIFIMISMSITTIETYSQQDFFLPRINSPITLDGFSNEAAWNEIEPLPLTMYSPKFGGESTEKTEVRIAYDDNNIYVSAKLYDSNPEYIQANSLVRDLDRGGDYFNLLIDSYNDNETFLGFSTTPAGNRLDWEINNDAEGNTEADFWNNDWNEFWENAVVQNKEGWFVEMRIPFSSLRFQDDNGKVVFGIMVHRLINRKNERVTFPAVLPKWDTGVWKASNAKDVVLTGVYSQKPFHFSPYVLSGYRQLYEVSTTLQNYKQKNSFTKEFGFDIKYGITSNFYLDVTVNTDFAQVEADDELINLTRFPIFFPEKRQFFQERSGIFSFKTGDDSRLFHSRKIGITEDGKPVRILGGARLVGRTGPWDIGFLSMQTEANYGSPGENFSVFRLRRRTFNQYSYLGSMITSRLSNKGNFNIATGIDGHIRVFDDDYLAFNFVKTFERDTESSNSTLVRASWERRNSKGFGYNFEFTHTGKNYNPSIGFIGRNNFLKVKGNILYGYFFNDISNFYKHTPRISSEFYVDNNTGNIETALSELSWQLDFKSGAYLSLTAANHYERIQENFNLLDKIKIVKETYSFNNLSAVYSMSFGEPLRTDIKLVFGSFYNGNQTGFTLTPVWNHSKHFELSGDYEFNNLQFSKQRQNINVNIFRLRILLALDIHFSTNSFLQYNSYKNKFDVNFRVRYNFQEGHDLYLVYNETLNTRKENLGIMLPEFENRQILLKYIYTLFH